MCSIVGISGSNNKEDLELMLKTLRHRGPDGYGFYDNNSIFHNEQLIIDNIKSANISFAHNLLSIVGNNELQPLFSERYVLVSNAEIYNYQELINEYDLVDFKTNSDCEVILKLIDYFYDTDLKSAVINTINIIDGDYAFAITDFEDYMVVRDAIGVKPVYYANYKNKFAFSSEQKALKAIGCKNILNLEPTSAIFNNEIINIRSKFLRKSTDISYSDAKRLLAQYIEQSVYKRVQNLNKVSVLFSGGVDSTLIAVLLKKYDIDVDLYTVGTENSQDLKFAKKASEDINLPLKIKILTVDDIENSFEETLNAIEDTNLMKLGVGMTINLTSKLACMDNHNVILSGQGADELFSGYNRYNKKYDKPEELLKELSHGLNNMYHVNLERDDKATMNNSIELRVPYLDKKIINFVKNIPIKYLLSSSEDNLRKHLLRDVAYELGVPKYLAYRPKKAAQYGTGIDKILRKKIIKQEKFANLLNK